MKKLLWLMAGVTALLLTACGGDDASQGHDTTLSSFSVPVNVARQPMATLQQTAGEPTRGTILDGVLEAQGTAISDLQKDALADRLQQMIDAGTDSNLQIALVLAANTQIRSTVIGDNVAQVLADKVGEVRDWLVQEVESQKKLNRTVAT